MPVPKDQAALVETSIPEEENMREIVSETMGRQNF
jgi:hypothetical protein